ncbi:hypothetical protein ANO11243_066940 [Dothideomycetidae sp. 11243]|nr:hypothetical protein ANO11243_066940 [fungal sp. No.11243]
MSDSDASKEPRASAPQAHNVQNPPKPKRRLPGLLDHFNARDLKTLCRCSMAFWVASLLIFIDKALLDIGKAAFFGCIVLLFLPPSGVVLTFILSSMTMLIGMAIGWAWGVITMKAAQATRPTSALNARLLALQKEAKSTGTSAQVLVYQGFLLDNRVTVTFFMMLGLLIYLLEDQARLRIKFPKLILTSIFGSIIIDIFLTSGPILPAFNGTIAATLIKPAAAAIAIGLACSILIFPESTSHLVLDDMHRVVTAMSGSLESAMAFLISYPEVHEAEQLQSQKLRLIAAWSKVEPSMTFLQFDTSYGQWSPEDIVALKEPVKLALIASLNLLDLQYLHVRFRDRGDTLLSDSDGAQGDGAVAKHVHGKHQIKESLNLVRAIRQPEIQTSVVRSYQALADTSKPILQAAGAALDAFAYSVRQSNSRRWYGNLSGGAALKDHQEHVAVLEQLREEMAKYPAAANAALLVSHEDLFAADGTFRHESANLPQLSGLFVGFNFEERIVRVAAAAERALTAITMLEKERTSRRIWFPFGLRNFVSWAFGTSSTPSLVVPASTEIPQIDKKALKQLRKRMKSGRVVPARRRNRVAALILGVGHWISSDEGLFGFRVLLATVVAAVIAVTSTTAGFFAREKGIWAVIMAQTGVMPYMADFTVGLVSRVGGTILGGVLGMIGWYIGSGNGPGNSYGLAASTAVVGIILMWLRLFAPPPFQQAVILAGATAALVFGYGFIDTHNPGYGNPGIGYEVFWRRTLLVLVGFAISFIISCIPWPSSSSRFIARSLSNVLHAETDHYAVLLTSWRTLGEDRQLIPVIGDATIHISETLAALNGPIGGLKFEFSSSVFDRQTCSRIKSSIGLINESLARLHIRAILLPPNLRARFEQSSGILDDFFIGDTMAVLSILVQTLRTGDALPSRLPTPLMKRTLEKGSQVESFTREMLQDEAVRGYCVAMSAYLAFLSSIDELVLILKSASGEAHHVPEDLAYFDKMA